MSTTDGDAASRLDDAIAGVLGADARGTSRAGVVPPATTDDDWNVDGPDNHAAPAVDGPYVLPDIIPATPVEATVDDEVDATAEVRSPAPAPTMPRTPAAAPTAAAASTAPATSWSDHMVPVPAGTAGAGLRTPGRRPRVRRVTRVVRHVDPWSTFKLSLLFSVVAYLVALTSGVLLWRVAASTGTLDNVERWFTQFGWETFELDGAQIFHNAWIIGLFGAVAMTGAMVLLATLFNLVSDIVGGIRVTVLEEEVVERTISSTRRYVVRRPPVGAEAASAWDVEGGDEGGGVDVEAEEARVTTSPAATSVADWSVDDEDEVGDAPDGAGTAPGRSG